MTTLIVIIVFLGGLGTLVWLYLSNRGQPLSVTLRLGRYGVGGFERTEDEVSDIVTAEVRQRSEQRAVTRAVEAMVGNGPFSRRITGRLEQADVKWTAAEFIVVWIAAILMGALIGLIALGAIGFLVGLAVGGIGPWFYLGRRAKKRKKKFIEQLADMAQMMGNSMRAGFSIIQSMEMVAVEGPSPAKDEFERVVTEVKLGLPLDNALDHLLARMPSEDLALAIVAINVQRQVGGNLSEILMVISKTVRERVRFQRDLSALTAQARYSSYIITGLPIAVAVIINIIDHPYESFLYTQLLGHIMLVTAVCMLGLGFFFLNRIANIEV